MNGLFRRPLARWGFSVCAAVALVTAQLGPFLVCAALAAYSWCCSGRRR